MKLLRMIKAYFEGNVIVVVQGENNKYSYFKGENIEKRFLLNSFTNIIKLNI